MSTLQIALALHSHRSSVRPNLLFFTPAEVFHTQHHAKKGSHISCNIYLPQLGNMQGLPQAIVLFFSAHLVPAFLVLVEMGPRPLRE